MRSTAREAAIDAYVGSRVREARGLRGLTQDALGKKLGLTFQQVQKYENGKNRIAVGRLVVIAEVLDMPISFFLDGVERSDPPDIAPATREQMAFNDLFRRIPEARLQSLRGVMEALADG